MRTFIKNLFERIFGKNIPLEHFAFICVAISGVFMAAIGIVGNSSLGLPSLTQLVPAIFIAVDVSCVIYSIVTKRWEAPALIAVGSAIFALFPFLWFTTGGATGSTMPLMVTSGLCIVVIFKGRLRLGLLIADIAMCSSFVLLEYFYPGIYVPYPSRFAWYTDMIIGMVLSFVVNAALAYLVMTRYDRARKEEAALAQKLARISLTDPLTGIYNRRFLTSSIDEEMRKSYDSGIPLCICIMDIDHFKRINDNYGHVYGDEVLTALSRIVSSCLGENQVFGRYGGEEFLILFKGAGIQEALPVVQRLCDKVKAYKWPHGGTITLSCGLSAYMKGIHYSAFIENADRNLYRAKEGGRDRIVFG